MAKTIIGFSNCRQCYAAFIKYRSDSIHCSKRCKNKYYNEQRERRKEYYLKNKDKHIETKRQYYKKNYARIVVSNALNRAVNRDLPFNIDESDIIIPTHCPLLGIEIKINYSGKRQNNSPTLDRFIPELGYIKGNVWMISWKANRIKSDLNKEELKMFCENVLKRLNEA